MKPSAAVLCLVLAIAMTASAAVGNIGLSAMGATARSWELGIRVIPEHESSKANDGSFHTYWSVRAEDLPADLGLEWPQPRKVGSLVVRYSDGRMVRGPAVARTQEWARAQYWEGTRWRDLDAQIVGQETSVVRYVFAPVTTTRVRLLFSEPPDPEGRRSPEPLGISVCELEAYETAPFQIVKGPDRLVKVLRDGDNSRDYLHNYNEPPSGDGAYDIAQPLIIEPLETRVFTDTLSPTLIVAESRWAREPAAAERTKPQVYTLRNGFLQLDISTADGVKEARLTNRVTGESAATPDALGFLVRTGSGEYTPAQLKFVKAEAAAANDAAHLRIDLASEKLDISVHYDLGRQNHFVHKWLAITPKGAAPVEVRDVVVSSLGLPRTLDLMAGQELTYPVAKLERGGFFSCLETFYWEHRGDALVYFPGATVQPGASFETEKAAIGVFQNRGEQWRGWDRGVREWVAEYQARISPVSKEWPDVYSEGWSVKVGAQELVERPEWMAHTMALAEKLGIRYMDGYEPAHQVLVLEPDIVKRYVELATRHNVATGWWVDFGSDIDWGTGAPLKPFPCLLAPEAEAYMQKIVELTRTYKLRAMHWADFYSAFPCNRTGHGHLPGKYSIYAQGRRMLRFGQQLREASPGIMLGADGGFTNPQMVRYEDSRAHGTFYGGYEGDHFPAVEPDIHLDRLYADMNRVYGFGSHAVYLRPWYRMLNCVNHFGQESHQHDRAGFRYSLLSALAMAGQVTFNDIPESIQESEIEFANHWLGWAKKNREYLKQTDKLFDRSVHFADVWQGDAQSLSGFAHIRGDRGYVFLLNPSAVEQVAELTIALDAPPAAQFSVEEVFPGGVALRGPADGRYPQGGKLRVTVPAKQVRVLWIIPASESAPVKMLPEDARAAEARRYIAEWNVARTSDEAATLRAAFQFPKSGAAYLSSQASERQWAGEPWAYDKAYLVILLKDETRELNDNWLNDRLGRGPAPMIVSVNGVARSVHALKTGRNQHDGLTRCYFVGLSGETRPGETNQVEVSVPNRNGVVFQGAYLDLPDQMPLGE